MANELRSLSQLFQKSLFRIPDYQRGYAWQQQQLVDFWEDLVNLQDDRYHYIGSLSLKLLNCEETKGLEDDRWLFEEEKEKFQAYHIVDGQQRITTFVILLNEIILFIKGLKENSGKSDDQITISSTRVEDIISQYICKKHPPDDLIITYLFGYEKDNPSAEYMRYEIFKEKSSPDIKETYYTKNLKFAKEFFDGNLRKLYDEAEDGVAAINLLYKNLTQRFMFNVHEIDDDYDVFVAFETMNNRGKKLTNLELLKNRLIYLTTLFGNDKLDEAGKTALRGKINDTWKEVYYQLGRNKTVLLSDDDLLRAHWIIYYGYSRNHAGEYIKFLFNKFSSKRIFEKKPILVESTQKEQISDEPGEAESEAAGNEKADDTGNKEESKLHPEDIKDYVDSLKDMAKYWYYSFFPDESNLTDGEKKSIDRLNRIGISYFRPLVTAMISRKEVSAESRIRAFDAIERFIFVAFRMGHFNSTYGSSVYYNAAHDVYGAEGEDVGKLVDELSEEIDKRTENDHTLALQNFTARVEKDFTSGNGYYDWNSLKYFFYEYESSLIEKTGIDHFRTWDEFTNSEKDKVSIEHILPQTPTSDYWKSQFSPFSESEINVLTGALGNLLPLAQSINSKLQNSDFADKKQSKEGRRGYKDGSHSEVEVSRRRKWTAGSIFERSEDLLKFMQDRWQIEFTPEQMEKLTGRAFVHSWEAHSPQS